MIDIVDSSRGKSVWEILVEAIKTSVDDSYIKDWATVSLQNLAKQGEA